MSMWKDSSSIAQIYKASERITGPPARHLIRLAGLLEVDVDPLVILDNACGTGVVSSQLYDMLAESAKDKLHLTCGDFSEGMVEAVQQRIESSQWKGATAQVVDAQNTGLQSDFYTHVLTNFGIMLMPDPTAALNECFRVLKSGGVCALSTWDTVGWIPDVRAALATIIGPPPFPEAETWLRSMGKGDWHRAAFVEQQLTAHGFEDIKVDIILNSTTIENASVFVEQFAGMVCLFTSNFWSKEDRDQYGGSIKPALLTYMTEKYGEGKPFKLEMVAIIASARKP